MSSSNNKSFATLSISFVSLKESHFPLLLKWFKEPHIKEWWDKEANYTMKSVYAKYISYIAEYKLDNNIKKFIYPYIINIGGKLAGYIQFYDFYDFPREYNVISENLPHSLAALDLFIGDPEFIHKGFGTKILELFTKNYVFNKFDCCFVDPEGDNISAIKAYEKAGFERVISHAPNIIWLIKNK